MCTPERSLDVKAYRAGLHGLRGTDRLDYIEAHPAEHAVVVKQIREQSDRAEQRLADREAQTGSRYVTGLDGKVYPRGAHLPYETWHRILELHRDGYSMRKIAAEVGCSAGTAHRIAKNYVLSEQA